MKAQYRRADCPSPGKLKVTPPENYLQYALTWYGLAGVLVISGLLAPGRSQAAVSPLRTKTPGKSVAYIKTQ